MSKNSNLVPVVAWWSLISMVWTSYFKTIEFWLIKIVYFDQSKHILINENGKLKADSGTSLEPEPGPEYKIV